MMFAIILCIITLAIYKTDFVYESFDDEDNAFEFNHLQLIVQLKFLAITTEQIFKL